ncbi:MAG: glycosyltransferase family 2 protein [Solirubrobacteraceae bacterium]
MTGSPDMTHVTLAVLTYDGRELLEATLPSVVAQEYDGEYTVLVVDGGSRDGTAEFVRERWPQIRVVELPENRGVAAALNRAVQESPGEFVALLNNDVELEPGWLAPLVGALRAHPEAASASGKLMRYHDRERIDAAGDVLLRSSAVINRGAGELDRGQYDHAEAVFGSCAGAALFRRAAFDAVGLFDVSYFAYLEDVDWAMRAQLAGFEARYEPAAVGYHMGGATTSRRSRFFGRLQRRNQLLLVVKTFPAGLIARHGWRIAATHALWLAASVRDGMVREHLRAWVEVATLLPATLRKRRIVQRSRLRPVAQVEQLMVAGLPASVSWSHRLLFELAPLTARRRSSRTSPRQR